MDRAILFFEEGTKYGWYTQLDTCRHRVAASDFCINLKPVIHDVIISFDFHFDIVGARQGVLSGINSKELTERHGSWVK